VLERSWHFSFLVKGAGPWRQLLARTQQTGGAWPALAIAACLRCLASRDRRRPLRPVPPSCLARACACVRACVRACEVGPDCSSCSCCSSSSCAAHEGGRQPGQPLVTAAAPDGMPKAKGKNKSTPKQKNQLPFRVHSVLLLLDSTPRHSISHLSPLRPTYSCTHLSIYITIHTHHHHRFAKARSERR
jgi:hypothetical protein